MARQPFTMESNLDKISEKIKENPKYALNEVGRQLVKEIRPNINKKSKNPRHKFMRATLQSWARRTEGDLIIGYKDPEKISYLRNTRANFKNYKWMYDIDDPIKPIVLKNLPLIEKLVAQGLAEGVGIKTNIADLEQKDIEP